LQRLVDDRELLLRRKPPPAGDAGDDFHENVSDIDVSLGLCLAPPAKAGVRSKRGAVHLLIPREQVGDSVDRVIRKPGQHVSVPRFESMFFIASLGCSSSLDPARIFAKLPGLSYLCAISQITFGLRILIKGAAETSNHPRLAGVCTRR
jgi:hypothetical protein